MLSLAGCSDFARHYFRNLGWCLFLELLRCFSSPGSPRMTMYSSCDTPKGGFPHSEISGSKLICQLPEAYRRLSRPSSPIIAKASSTCSYSLDPITLSSFSKASPLSQGMYCEVFHLARYAVMNPHIYIAAFTTTPTCVLYYLNLKQSLNSFWRNQKIMLLTTAQGTVCTKPLRMYSFLAQL